MELEFLCMGCMQEKGESPICPSCGYDESEQTSIIALPRRTLLNQQYLVGRILGSPGGFGITYVAWDVRLATAVAIKEYLPYGLALREADHATVVPHSRDRGELFRYGLEQFLNEARILAQFSHPDVVRVRTFFEENGTGYLVMDYYRGMSLAEYLEQQDGKLPAQAALAIMMPILDGLREVHGKGVLHRDIKPQNIYLTERGQPILLDFGAARLAFKDRSQSLSVILTEGFAPYEQYLSRGKQGPWTDIYACGATLYFMLTGKVPPPGGERKLGEDLLVPVEQLAKDLTPGLRTGVMQALAVEPNQRPQDVRTFQALLLGETPPPVESTGPKIELIPPTVAVHVEPPPTRGETPQPTQPLSGGGQKHWQYLAAGGVGLLLLLAVGGWALSGKVKQGETAQAPVQVAAIAPKATESPVPGAQPTSMIPQPATPGLEPQPAPSAASPMPSTEAKLQPTEPSPTPPLPGEPENNPQGVKTPPAASEVFQTIAGTRYETRRTTVAVSEPRKGAQVLHKFVGAGKGITVVALSKNYVKIESSMGNPPAYIPRADVQPMPTVQVRSEPVYAPGSQQFVPRTQQPPASSPPTTTQGQPGQSPTQPVDDLCHTMQQFGLPCSNLGGTLRR